jgi:hypothetical protein
MPRESDQLYPPGHDRTYSPEEMRVRVCGWVLILTVGVFVFVD